MSRETPQLSEHQPGDFSFEIFTRCTFARRQRKKRTSKESLVFWKAVGIPEASSDIDVFDDFEQSLDIAWCRSDFDTCLSQMYLQKAEAEENMSSEVRSFDASHP